MISVKMRKCTDLKPLSVETTVKWNDFQHSSPDTTYHRLASQAEARKLSEGEGSERIARLMPGPSFMAVVG